jgi:hypothetical protein
MHAVVRRYTGQGAGQLFGELERRTGDVERIIRGVPGFVAYTLIRTGDGGVSVTVCQDRAGTEESNRRAAEWIRQNVAAGSPPEVMEGTVLLQLGGALPGAGQPGA